MDYDIAMNSSQNMDSLRCVCALGTLVERRDCKAEAEQVLTLHHDGPLTRYIVSYEQYV